MGQISQVLTSIAFYQLAEKGLLSPEDDLTKHLPEFGPKKQPVLLKHLLTQSSGIRQPSEEELSYRGASSYRDAFRPVLTDTLLFAPGMYQFPTYFAFNLLGAVIEDKEGRDFHRIIRSITDTLKLASVVPDNPFITVKGRSDYYDRNIIAQVIHASPQDIRYRLPSEGFLSTAEDLVKLGNALLTSPLLSDSLKARMFRPPYENGGFQFRWGNGMMYLTLKDGAPVIVSRGLIKGGGAVLVIIPDEKIVLGWLTNLNDDTEELPGIYIASMFRDFIKK
jgi:CubicO group peptidase (beta-lactamase class C family)